MNISKLSLVCILSVLVTLAIASGIYFYYTQADKEIGITRLSSADMDIPYAIKKFKRASHLQTLQLPTHIPITYHHKIGALEYGGKQLTISYVNKTTKQIFQVCVGLDKGAHINSNHARFKKSTLSDGTETTYWSVSKIHFLSFIRTGCRYFLSTTDCGEGDIYRGLLQAAESMKACK